MFKYLILFLATVCLHAADKKVCLNMIVKNEKDVITRALTSTLPLIDYWVIVDTGSTDGTQKIIKDFMKEKGVPGELHERPWKNFGHNRNEALELARGKSDYVLFIDADEYFVYEPGFIKPKLDKDYYYINMRCGGTAWQKVHLITNHPRWRWEGVLHEVICPTTADTVATLNNIYNVYTSDGARSKDPEKYAKDAAILEDALKQDPQNSRNVFYLAQSYQNANKPELAIKTYEKRIGMKNGFDEEIFWSQLGIALLQEKLNMDEKVVIDSYKKAIDFRRTRLEPYYYLANYYRKKEHFAKAYEICMIGLTITKPKGDLLQVQDWMYEYGMLLEYSVAAYWSGRYQECQVASCALLKKENLPENVYACVEQNLGFANQKLLEKVCAE